MDEIGYDFVRSGGSKQRWALDEHETVNFLSVRTGWDGMEWDGAVQRGSGRGVREGVGVGVRLKWGLLRDTFGTK